ELRASVGSTEAILPERPGSRSSACWAPHLAHFLASHEGDRAAFFKNRHLMVGEPASSGSMSSPVRSEIHRVGRSKAVVAARSGPWDPVHRYDGGNCGHIWGVGRAQPQRRLSPTILGHQEVSIPPWTGWSCVCQKSDNG